ncbi:mitogen-activated protein kinase kinase kinase 7-interacting protein 3 homolog isoform X2 [Palaemon carinicauda]|uniref:mitogen-activated protein kinase kinase kinase 7-interacting protein 3 homolog isoform X2 n=1 Tax=Palaemon carinicauda TaxID=392227 RepID=UPI0035B62A63
MASDDRLPADTRNIPHMQLFHHLKQKFPDLRDNDVNESIQKYGLDRERCEEELSQKALIQRGGYYRHWSRSGSSLSSPTLSRVTSPIRTGIPSTPTTPVLTTTPASYHHITATQHVCGPVQSNGYLVCSYPTEMVPELRPVYTTVCQTPVTTNPMLCTPVVSNSPLYSWHPSASNGFRAAGIQPPRPGVVPCNTEDTPFSSREPSQSRSVTPPNSAPVTSSFDPFSAFENKEPVRRRSAETHLDGRKGLYYNKHNFENFCPSEHSPTPPIRNSAMDSPVTSTTTTTTFTRSYNVDPVNINGGNTNRPPPGPRHVSSLHLTPVPPHGAHHAPGPPQGDGTVKVCGRSYTSVNLQLRQPSTEPQPPIQIRSSGSSLTYSTSSLDHRQGSRSSLQISIGPTGGTISAMRTNLDNKNSPANTAFHIQYSSSANGASTPTGAAFPTTEDVVGQEGLHGQSRRPQTWYVSEPVPNEPRQRKSSLPECVGPPVSLHPLHYPPSSDAGLGYNTGEPVWAVPPARPNLSYSQAIVQEQSIRKQKLATELAKQIEEKGKLQSEVEMMMRELEARENQRKRNADSNTKRIEEVQRENQRLQSECDEMENKILRIAPDIGQDDYSGIPSSQPYHEPPVAPQLIRASSGSSLGSGTGTPQTPHTPYTPQIPGTYIPPRPAAPPPPPPVPNFRGFQGVPGDTVEERTPKWGCTKCTFLNHPDMNKCEMCECPRFTIGTASSHHAALPPHHQGPCYCHRQHAPGELQDIHIQVRHQNFQSPRSQEYPGWTMV